MRYASISDRLQNLGSEKWALHAEARRLKSSGTAVIELTIGEPDFPPDPLLLAEAARAMNAGRYRYSDGQGEPALIEALVRKYKMRRTDVANGNVLCFPGTQTALFAVMLGLVEAGDAVLVGDPQYATYEGVIHSTGARQVPVPLYSENGFHMRADDLRACITPDCRVLLLNTPHNPTGAVLTAAEIAALGAVCQEYNLWIVCDEVYEQLVFDTNFASPFDNIDLAERTIVVSSISKSHAAPGFRSGWAIGPEEFCARLLPISETMLFGNQPFIADMTAFALDNPISTAALMRETYKARANRVEKGLAGATGISTLTPEAGMFVLIDVEETGLTGEQFAWALLREERVALMPGASFGKQANTLIRLSLTVPDSDLDEACRRIRALAERCGVSKIRVASM